MAVNDCHQFDSPPTVDFFLDRAVTPGLGMSNEIVDTPVDAP